jgi:hypothetical protein
MCAKCEYNNRVRGKIEVGSQCLLVGVKLSRAVQRQV